MNKKGNNVTIKDNVVIGDNVIIGDNVYIDYNCIIRDNVTIGDGTSIGANCILGEVQSDWYENHHEKRPHPLNIGKECIIRSNNIIYGDSVLGDYFQTGHNVTIREKAKFGNHCSLGTLSDVQGDCQIGNYVRCHSNVHIGMKTVIKDFVWVFPYVVFTNDPIPPSEILQGVVVESFAVIATRSVILPGVHIEGDTLVAAGAVVTKDVKKPDVVGGNPAKKISTIDNLRNPETGEHSYPWRYHFDRNMPWQGIGYDEWSKSNR